MPAFSQHYVFEASRSLIRPSVLEERACFASLSLAKCCSFFSRILLASGASTQDCFCSTYRVHSFLLRGIARTTSALLTFIVERSQLRHARISQGNNVSRHQYSDDARAKRLATRSHVRDEERRRQDGAGWGPNPFALQTRMFWGRKRCCRV